MMGLLQAYSASCPYTRYNTKKDLDFFKRHDWCLKSQLLDASRSCQQQSEAIMEGSYEFAFEFAKQNLTQLGTS